MFLLKSLLCNNNQRLPNKNIIFLILLSKIILIMEPQYSSNPVHFVKNPQHLEKLECLICMQKQVNLLQCKTCKIILCNKCTIDQKRVNNRCPYKCTTGSFQLVLLQTNLQYSCPFSSKCLKILKSVKQFYEHDRNCQYITPEQKKRQMRKWQFKCVKDHSLQVYRDAFQQTLIRRKCGQCGQMSMSRVVCNKCDEFYCRYCRPFPVYNLKCPLGHLLQKRDLKNKTYVCDICQINPVIIGANIYEDFLCNVGICQACFKNWPSFEKPVDTCQNKNNFCDFLGYKKHNNQKKFIQQHRLTLLSERIEQKCSWCQKLKICVKKCEKCVKYFCFQCKRIKIMVNGQCQFGHKMSKEYLQEDLNPGPICIKCSKNLKASGSHYYWKDEKCNMQFCKLCYQNAKDYSADVCMRQSHLNYKRCPKGNHINFYLPYENWKARCNLCKKIKEIKMECGICQNYSRYCCPCLPPNNIMRCYCGKELVQVSDVNKNMCLYCDKICENQIYGCRPCYYTICSSCAERYSLQKMKYKLDQKLETLSEEKY